MREAMEVFMAETVKAGEPIPNAVTTKVDFDEFDPGHETKQYFVEWLGVSIPQSRSFTEATQAA